MRKKGASDRGSVGVGMGEGGTSPADPHGMRALLRTALYDADGESVEGAFVDHWVSNASTARRALQEIVSRHGFSSADAVLLRQALRASDVPPDASRLLLEDLGRFAEGVREVVRQLLHDPEPRLRRVALQAGASLFDPAFLTTFLDDPDACVRVTAVTTLGDGHVRRKFPEAQTYLIRALDDPARRVRIAAAGVVPFCACPAGGEALARRLAIEPDVAVRRAIITAVARETQRAGIHGGCGGLPLREAIGEPIRQMLLRELHNEDAEVRRLVAGALARVGGVEVATAMLERLMIEDDRDVRRALVHYPGPGYFSIRERAVPLFSSLLRTDPDLATRSDIAFAMGFLGAEAAPALLEVLDDPESGLHRSATISLMRVGDARALPGLMREFADPARRHHRREIEQAIRDITIRAATSEPLRPRAGAPEHLQERIDSLRPDPATEWPARVCKEEFNALPIHSTGLVLWAIRPDGVVLRMDHEAFGHPTEEEQDPLTRFAVVVQGARRYPELREMIPPPPGDAHPCGSCLGTGRRTGEAGSEVCSLCGGLGWQVRA